ncbi:uncharacterized protein Dana_GF24002, isoform C [Drosophila ananassae]|uniref:Uncharacterized protein, isoform C n=1 Tax=Drosophila ananassae TaxID=7217 RepID=A0A0N8P0Z4_DROAN|nr:carcinine transporter isoform X2 [Drosophila ananassae]KPU78492.1 uncharacterized protein Dana_GF24002, isoform C [Drosophila ananassae]
MPTDTGEQDKDFLPIIGEFGAYQKLLTLCMLPAAFLFAFSYMGQLFMILLPRKYWCRIRELENRSKEEQLALAIPKLKNGEIDKCNMYKVETNWSDINVTEADDSWPKIPCDDGWIYDNKRLTYPTISTENNWVCSRDTFPTITFVVFFMGSIIGSLVCGYITDHWGRVKSFFLANLCVLVGGCWTSMCDGFYCFNWARFVVGFGMNDGFMTIYILTLENVGAKYRTLVGNLAIAVAFTSGGALLPWIALWCGDWKFFNNVITLPFSILLLFSVFIPESPTWLLSMGKIDKGMEVLKQAARMNKKTISDEVWSNISQHYTSIYDDQKSQKTYSWLDLFKKKRRTGVILIIMADPFLVFSLSTLTELPAGIVPLVLLDRIGRKPVTISVMILCAVCSLLAVFAPTAYYEAIAGICGRFFIAISTNVREQWAAEIIPTVVRGQGMSIVHVMGCVGCLVSPLLIYTESLYNSLPMMIVTLISAIGGCIVIFLPETMNATMPSTLEEADQRWTLSVSSSSKRARKEK